MTLSILSDGSEQVVSPSSSSEEATPRSSLQFDDGEGFDRSTYIVDKKVSVHFYLANFTVILGPFSTFFFFCVQDDQQASNWTCINDVLEESLKNLELEVSTLPDPILPDNHSDNESPVLRRKTDDRSIDQMNEEEVYAELKRICHPGNPKHRFEMKSELGAG